MDPRDAFDAGVVQSLIAAIDARDGYTGEHSEAVCKLALTVGRHLGLTAAALAELEIVAQLHDVGKIGIPDEILNKPGPLSQAEWKVMQSHPVIGARILAPLAGLADVTQAIRHEHERWDGTGYPDGLAGEAIPLASRIVLACDAFHTLRSDRPYLGATTFEAAVEEVRRSAGTQLDPAVVTALLEVLGAPGAAPAPPEPAARRSVPARRRGDVELEALLEIATGAGRESLEEFFQFAARVTLETLVATSVSISRWDHERAHLHSVATCGDPGAAARTATASVLSTPIRAEASGEPWGELTATRTGAQPQFVQRDARFLHRVAEQVAIAFGRGELTRLAFEDGLTGLANRRAFDEALDEALRGAAETGGHLSLILCDLDRLKELNDHHGHQAGDAALRSVASTLRATAAGAEGTLLARLGGDEFAILLSGHDADTAFALASEFRQTLADGASPLGVSCGVAEARDLRAASPGDLIRAADAALYAAKRAGRGRVCLAEGDLQEAAWQVTRHLRHREGVAADAAAAVAQSLQTLLPVLDERLKDADAYTRLCAVLDEFALRTDASSGAVSFWTHGDHTLRTVYGVDRRSGRVAAEDLGGDLSEFALDEYPATARLLKRGGALLVSVDDETADPAERALLVNWGFDSTVGVAEADAHGVWLLELFADATTAHLEAVTPALRLAVAQAVRSGAARLAAVPDAA